MNLHNSRFFFSKSVFFSGNNLVIVAGAFLLFLFSNSNAQVEEYPLKSLFLEAAVRFITWPNLENYADSSKDFFIVGIFDQEKMFPYLKKAFSKKKIKNKDVLFLLIDSLPQISSCNMLFISDNEKYQLNRIFKLASGSPILTVSDSPELIKRGVILSIIIESSKIMCYINESEAIKSHFKISHHLLQKSIVVENQEHKH